MASDLSGPESAIRPEVEKEPGPFVRVRVRSLIPSPRLRAFPFIFSSVRRDKGQG